ncbi:MAG TPA: hypothetical protein DD658_09650 [Deltaproteobacteria bacterium]|nr:hypothetical protein [Deltaproteobacteria bacterium]
MLCPSSVSPQDGNGIVSLLFSGPVSMDSADPFHGLKTSILHGLFEKIHECLGSPETGGLEYPV